MTDEQYLKKLGQRIVDIRNTQGLMQIELATKLGISVSYMRRLEKGGVNPTVKTLRKLSKKLGVSVSELVDVEK